MEVCACVGGWCVRRKLQVVMSRRATRNVQGCPGQQSRDTEARYMRYPPGGLRTRNQEIQEAMFRDLQISVPNKLSKVLVV